MLLRSYIQVNCPITSTTALTWAIAIAEIYTGRVLLNEKARKGSVSLTVQAQYLT